MFILYGKQADVWKIIDMSVDKKDIINDMIDISNNHNFFDYKIEETMGSEKKSTIIKGKTEFKAYLDEYKSRIKPLKDESCVDLKRYILNKKGNFKK